ncbi:MAG: radical SAM family heme chaperone HemW [Clostridia bacterium]
MSGLYVHVPFCVKKCAYCDFFSVPPELASVKPKEYLKLLDMEAKLYSDIFRNTAFSTVFIGGGTPSLFSPTEIEELFNLLHENFKIDSNAEITFEANPGTLTAEKIESFVKSGANRASIGLQSASDTLLRSVGRIHTFSEFLTSISLLRSANITNINTDIMYGFPNQTMDDLKNTLNAVISLDIPHISAYSLILEENTPLFERVSAGIVSMPDEDFLYAMDKLVQKRLSDAGYMRYEVSGYAKDGAFCAHNLNYWHNGEYLGLGAASHSSLREIEDGFLHRHANAPDLSYYKNKLLSAEKPIDELETVSRHDEMFEFIMLGLRLTTGIETREFSSRFSVSIFDIYGTAIDALVSRGLLSVNSERIVTTDRGFDLLNMVILEFA